MVATKVRVQGDDIVQELNVMPSTDLETIKGWLAQNASNGPYAAQITISVDLDSADLAAFQATFGGTETNDV